MSRKGSAKAFRCPSKRGSVPLLSQTGKKRGGDFVINAFGTKKSDISYTTAFARRANCIVSVFPRARSQVPDPLSLLRRHFGRNTMHWA